MSSHAKTQRKYGETKLPVAVDCRGGGGAGHRAGDCVAVNQPFVISTAINNPYSLTDMYHGQVDPFPYVYTNATAKFSLPMGLFTVLNPNVTTPYLHQLSFSIEHSMPSSIVLKAGYSGKLAHNLVRMEQMNPAVYIPGSSTVANTNQRRILAAYGYASFRNIDTNSSATYHSLQLSLNKRVTKGRSEERRVKKE